MYSTCFSAFSCGETVSGRKGEIKIPNHTGSYGNNLNCIWTIQVDDGEMIIIEFLDFDVEKSFMRGIDCVDNFFVSNHVHILSNAYANIKPKMLPNKQNRPLASFVEIFAP